MSGSADMAAYGSARKAGARGSNESLTGQPWAAVVVIAGLLRVRGGVTRREGRMMPIMSPGSVAVITCPVTSAAGELAARSGQGPSFARLSQVLGAVAQSGSAPRSHRGGQGFKSPQLHLRGLIQTRPGTRRRGCRRLS